MKLAELTPKEKKKKSSRFALAFMPEHFLEYEHPHTLVVSI